MTEQFYIAVDLGGTNLKICLSDSNGKMTDQSESSITDIKNNVKDLEDLVIKKISQYYCKEKEKSIKISGICMSFPSIIDKENIIVLSTNIPNEFSLERLRTYFVTKYNVHFYLINDVNSATLGEQWKGAIGDCKNALYVNVGTGLSMGIIVNGELYTGTNNAAGEIAYCVETLTNNFSAIKAPLEEKFSGAGIKAKVLSEFKRKVPEPGTWLYKNLKEDFSNLDTKLIFEGYRNHDPVAIKVINKGILELSKHLVNIIFLLDPSLIVFGGGLSQDSDCFIPQIQSNLEKSLPFVPIIKTASLGRVAGLYGAVKHILISKGEKSGK